MSRTDKAQVRYSGVGKVTFLPTGCDCGKCCRRNGSGGSLVAREVIKMDISRRVTHGQERMVVR